MNRLAIVRALMVAAGVASVATSSGAAEKPKDFAFGIPLTVEAESAFYRAALPEAFYAGSARADQGDLRVFNGDGAVVHAVGNGQSKEHLREALDGREGTVIGG